MPAVSQEELDEIRSQNDKLRDKLDRANLKKSEQEAARNREFEAAQLATENVRLQAQVASAEATARADVTREGTTGLIDSVQSEYEAAMNRLENPEGVPVDTNADKQPNDTGATKAVENGKVETDGDGVTTVTTPEKNGSN